MRTLDDNLKNLMRYLAKLGQTPPAHQIRVVEIRPGTATDGRGRLRVQRIELRTPETYNDRFDELMAAGFPWINMSSLGVEGDVLIVGIETPRTCAAGRTSVNYSGPSAAVLQSGWAVDGVLLIE